MTTLTGMETNDGEKRIILASDLTRTSTSWRQTGDVVHREQTTSQVPKIHVSEGGDFALAATGVIDPAYVDFLREVLADSKYVKEAVNVGGFPEVAKLNLDRWGGKVPTDDVTGLLVATNYGEEPALYTCWPLGLVERRTWTSIGSGSKYALDYMNERVMDPTKTAPPKISFSEGLDATVTALDRASVDIHTGGLDVVVVASSGIQTFGKDIRDAADEARRKVVADLKAKYE